jgi:hypothetical protein
MDISSEINGINLQFEMALNIVGPLTQRFNKIINSKFGKCEIIRQIMAI